MPAYTKYDPRVDALVVECRTAWAPAVGQLSEEDRRWLAAQVHRHPELAAKIAYERMHTGFSREIEVTPEDVARIYQSALTNA